MNKIQQVREERRKQKLKKKNQVLKEGKINFPLVASDSWHHKTQCVIRACSCLNNLGSRSSSIHVISRVAAYNEARLHFPLWLLFKAGWYSAGPQKWCGRSDNDDVQDDDNDDAAAQSYYVWAGYYVRNFALDALSHLIFTIIPWGRH